MLLEVEHALTLVVDAWERLRECLSRGCFVNLGCELVPGIELLAGGVSPLEAMLILQSGGVEELRWLGPFDEVGEAHPIELL